MSPQNDGGPVRNRGAFLRRTLGEFGVIVLGVLVALAVDGWAETRRERSTEAEYLARLEADLEEDSLQVADLLDHFAAREEHTRDLLDGIRQPAAFDRDRDDVITAIIVATLDPPSFRPTDYTIQELENTGNLILIRSGATRSAILRAYSVLNEWADHFSDYWRPLHMSEFSFAVPDDEWEKAVGGGVLVGEARSTLESFRTIPDWELRLRTARRTVTATRSILGRIEALIGYTLCVIRSGAADTDSTCVDASGL